MQTRRIVMCNEYVDCGRRSDDGLEFLDDCIEEEAERILGPNVDDLEDGINTIRRYAQQELRDKRYYQNIICKCDIRECAARAVLSWIDDCDIGGSNDSTE